ncbi:MAG: DUF3088 family protein [Myxococcales bacterium]|nr:DUF3088 family protein [Myxococcales bacterium]
MAKDTLYVLRPGFQDKGATYFCPYSAQVIGFLDYYPQVRATLDVVELGFDKPREPLSEVLGEDLQSAPMLVLAGEGEPVTNVTIAHAKGRAYVEKTIQILRYLAATRGVPLPH